MGDKIKLENYSADRICDGCLSSNRTITPLGELTELFYMLARFPASNIFLCWECKGVLKKTWRFQQRLQQAQYILQQATLQLKNPEEITLSTLGTAFNGKYETIQENASEEDVKRMHLKIELETSNRTKPEEIKEEVDDRRANDSDLEQSSEEFYEVEESIVENSTIEVCGNNKLCLKSNDMVIRKHDKRRCKYLKYAVVSENIFNDAIDNYGIKSFLCEETIKELLDRRLLVKQKKSARFKCKDCDVNFYKVIDWKRHNIIEHPPKEGPYKCCECDVDNLPTISDLRVHWTTHEIFRCQKCSEPFKSQEEMNVHMQMIHSYTYRCVDCGCNFFSSSDFLCHYKELHVKMTCDYCKRTFTRKRILETHIRRRHLPPVCTICGRSYKTFHALDAHGRSSHPELFYDVTKTELSYCVECNKQFNSVYAYKRHLATAFVHRPPKPVRIPCPDCGKVFSRKVYMNNHYRLFHVKKSKHHCEICNKYYVTAYALRSHRQRIHEKTYPPKNKICDICGRGFSTNRVLANHRRTHTGERPFKCSQCPAAFAQKCAKKSHERSQHKIF